MDKKTEDLFMGKIRECDALFHGTPTNKKRAKMSANVAIMARIMAETGEKNRDNLIAEISNSDDRDLAIRTLGRLTDLLVAGGMIHECTHCGKCGVDEDGNPKHDPPKSPKEMGLEIVTQAIKDATAMVQHGPKMSSNMMDMTSMMDIDLASFSDDELPKA